MEVTSLGILCQIGSHGDQMRPEQIAHVAVTHTPVQVPTPTLSNLLPPHMDSKDLVLLTFMQAESFLQLMSLEAT